MLTARQDWVHLLEGDAAADLMRGLPNILQTRRWFGGKARRISSVRIQDAIAIPSEAKSVLLLLHVEYEAGESEVYSLPVTAVVGKEAQRIQQEIPRAALVPFELTKNGTVESGILYDALWNRDFTSELLGAIRSESRFEGTAGVVVASATEALSSLLPAGDRPNPVVMGLEQSNTSVAYDGHVILKLYRRLGEGMNPDLEIGRVLTRLEFPFVPTVAGAIEYQKPSGETSTLGVLQRFVANEGDAWTYSLKAVKEFFGRVASEETVQPNSVPDKSPFLEVTRESYPPTVRHLMGGYLESAERLGQRTAELHRALGRVRDNPAFAPEPITAEYRQARHDAALRGMEDALTLVKDRRGDLSEGAHDQANLLSELAPALERIFDAFLDLKTQIALIRCHGDYHLGQVLFTGGDFMITDFEGEPARPLAERRMKHPPLVDIAGMIRSFQYVPFAFLKDSGQIPSRWCAFWSHWACVGFLKGYLGALAGGEFWPQNNEDVGRLLDAYVAEKALYELKYELNNRPDWVEIPLQGLVKMLTMRAHNNVR